MGQSIASIVLCFIILSYFTRYPKEEKQKKSFFSRCIYALGNHSGFIYYFHPFLLNIGIRIGGCYTASSGGVKVIILWILLSLGSLLGAWIFHEIKTKMRNLKLLNV